MWTLRTHAERSHALVPDSDPSLNHTGISRAKPMLLVFPCDGIRGSFLTDRSGQCRAEQSMDTIGTQILE
jgi:hypothetical protein